MHYTAEKDGLTAFQRLTASPVHLVISDFNMPGMDGLQLLEALRGHKVTQKVGFILITGRADPALIERGKKLAMNNFLAKPFDAQKMKGCIEQVVGRL